MHNLEQEEKENLSFISGKELIKENEALEKILENCHFLEEEYERIKARAIKFIDHIKQNNQNGVESFLAKYKLSSKEGVALITLAESLLRIKDDETAAELVVDKLASANWLQFLEDSDNLLLKFSSLGLHSATIFAKFSEQNIISKLAFRIGRSSFLASLKTAMKILGKEFIIGNDINSALNNIKNLKKNNFHFSFDLLGESARSYEQAEIYYQEYLKSIPLISKNFQENFNDNIMDRPNLSVKFTALHPRFELLKEEIVKDELIPKLLEIVKLCKEHKVGLSFDAEEASRLDLYLKIFTILIKSEEAKNFDGIGIVIQAYQKRAFYIIDYVAILAKNSKKIIPVRLVKGAYWDSEIKIAQELGLEDYPVFTKKEFTDASYIACAKKMFNFDKYIYPQFATHNAITASTICELAKGKNFEFQKLKGMGDALHEDLVKKYKVRIYSPVGKFNDLLAYLMRRLLENGANSSFVHQVHDKNFSSQDLIFPLVEKCQELLSQVNKIPNPKNIYNNRANSQGVELGNMNQIEDIKNKLLNYENKKYEAHSIINGKIHIGENKRNLISPADKNKEIGISTNISGEEISKALELACEGFSSWEATSPKDRAAILRKIAELYEENQDELLFILIKEAGKSINDAIAEVREAIDFCRYYANSAEDIFQEIILPSPTGESNKLSMHPRGVFVCISPWNFPLAIFTGQIVAALVSGNSVIAKPASQTTIIANFAVSLMHKSGIPAKALQLIIASGKEISDVILKSPKIAGVVFTGSTETAQQINQTLSNRKAAIAQLIAETGGQNAMIVDSSALLEQVTDSVIASAFHSAGQRCSALRVLYIQEEIFDSLIEMIVQATKTLKIGDTSNLLNDIGPVIDQNAVDSLKSHINDMKSKGFEIIYSAENILQNQGSYFMPHIIKISSINDLVCENFGPVLHVISYKSNDLDMIIEEINQYGFGLTFGIQSRIESKIEYISKKIKVGNIYANRSIIGAQVESQPFGGEGLSGTGFKAGGPHYLLRFVTERVTTINLTAIGGNIDLLK